MKKLITILTIIICSINSVSACPFCGCGTGNYYLGMLPSFDKHFIGCRYQYSSFKTSIKDDPTQFSNDRFQSVELWGGWNICKRWQVIAIVPFNFIHQASDDTTKSNSGIGDIAVIANYKLLNKVSATASKKLVSQQLWLGGGIKLATGNFSADLADEAFVAMANMQAGSASTDFLITSMYNISINNFGVTTGVRYKINTANSDQYYFGNRFSANSYAFYSVKMGHTTFTPNAGFVYEHNNANKLNNTKINLTGGYLFGAAAGLEINVKKMTFGCNAQLPISQNFSDHQTETKFRGMMHVTYAF